MTDTPTMVTKRSPEEIEALEKEHGHILMALDDFSLLNSPMGVLWIDKQHPDYAKIVGQCKTWVLLNGDKETAAKYDELLIQKV